MALEFFLVIVTGYLLGALPFGLAIARLTRGINVREYGSGNVGFANVLRTAGAGAGIATFILDIGKGTLAAWLGGEIVGGDGHTAALVAGGLAAVAGHNWSIYLKFHGGKGVNTSVGGLIAMSPWVGLICLAIGGTIILVSRYVSVGSMSGAVSSILILAPLAITGHEPAEYLIYTVIVTFLIVFRHRENISNLCAGTERRIGQRGEKR